MRGPGKDEAMGVRSGAPATAAGSGTGAGAGAGRQARQAKVLLLSYVIAAGAVGDRRAVRRDNGDCTAAGHRWDAVVLGGVERAMPVLYCDNTVVGRVVGIVSQKVEGRPSYSRPRCGVQTE